VREQNVGAAARFSRADELVREAARARSAPGLAVIGTDPVGRVVYWDEGAEELYEWSAAEVLGRNIVDVTPSETTRAEAAQVMKTLRSGEDWSGVFTVRNRSGRSFKVSVTDTPVFNAHGKLVGILGISIRTGKS
jgi:PAS domain S-box-containing protein